MGNPFGVEHEISKKLPSALRGKNPMEMLGPNNYANTRVAANAAGRRAAKSGAKNVPPGLKKANKGFLKGKPSELGWKNRQASRGLLP